MKKMLTLLGGLLTVIAPFLSLRSIFGITVTLFQTRSEVAYFIIGLGVFIVFAGLINRRFFYFLDLLAGIAITGLGIIYLNDTNSVGANVEAGIWTLLGGGALTITGAVMGLLKKR